jgi:hypothetical protein
MKNEPKPMDKIKAEAIDRVARRCAQTLQAAINHLEHAKIQLGYPGTLRITGEIDEEGESLVDSLRAALAEELPISPRRAICLVDYWDEMTAQQMESLSGEVKRSVGQLLGVR